MKFNTNEITATAGVALMATGVGFYDWRVSIILVGVVLFVPAIYGIMK